MYDLSVLYSDFKRVCLLYAKRIIDEKNVETKSIGSIDVGMRTRTLENMKRKNIAQIQWKACPESRRQPNLG